MTMIDKSKCIGCKICQTYCTVDAIEYNEALKKCEVNQDTCVECYVCLRMHVCPKDALQPIELEGFYKQFEHVIRDPVENHGVTGVTGRGTEEVKTNDVTGRVKRGEVGICIDMGRPGIGVYLRDAEKVAMAIAAAGTTLLPADATPIAALMTDLKTGKMEKDCLNYRLLSVIVEGGCPQEKLPDVMKALQKVSKEIDTVFSLGLIVVTDEHGKTDALDCLDDLGIAQPFRGKVNVGLGRPLADV